jgi:hypothetical protein
VTSSTLRTAGSRWGGWRTQEREGVPSALADVLREEADATGAETQGRRGEAVDVVPVEDGVLQRLCGAESGRCARELRQQTDRTDRGVLGTLSLATAVQCGHQVWTQWGHDLSPVVRCVGCLRRTT